MRRGLGGGFGLRRLRVPALALVALLGMAQPAAADQPWPEVLTLDEAALYLRVDRAELGQLAAWGQVPARRIGSQWRFSREALNDWLRGGYGGYAPARVTQLPQPASPYGYVLPQQTAVQPLAPVTMAQLSARGTTVAQAAPPPTPGERPEPIGEAPEEPTAEDVFLREQRVLLGTGEVTLELGLFYSRSDDQAFTAVGSGTALGTIEQDTFTASFTGRYGLTPDTELFASIPFRRQSSQTFVGASEVSSTARTETGDVRLGVRQTVLREGLGVPDVIVTVDGRIPTEESSYAVGGGVALVKSVDPVVLFANANYRHTFARAFADVTRLDFDDRIDTTLGFAFALNDTLTLSTAVSGVFTRETEFSNATLREQESFSLQFGLTSLLAKGLYIEPTVSFNLNGTGNDVVLGVSVPYSFTPGF